MRLELHRIRTLIGLPRRTKVYHFVQRWFHYIAIALAILGTTGLTTTNKMIYAIALILVSLFVIIYWESYKLNIKLENVDHPHHKDWTFSSRVLKPVANISKQAPTLALAGALWIIGFIAMALVTILSRANEVSTWVVIQGWVFFLPALWVGSWGVRNHSADWLLGLGLISILVFAICVLLSPTSEKIAIVISQASWLALSASTVHVLLRRISRRDAEAKVAVRVGKWLRENTEYLKAWDTTPLNPDPDERLNDVAQIISSSLGYERVLIILVDRKEGLLYLKGSNVTGEESSPAINWPQQGWSLEQKSITSWVARNKQEHVCMNAQHCNWLFEPMGFYPGFTVGSEFAVPILARGECVAVLDVESPQIDAFDESDLHLLRRLANEIGDTLTYKAEIQDRLREVYQLFSNTAHELALSRDLEDALGSAAQKICEVFDADLVILYRQAVGTNVPLPGLIWRGKANDPQFLIDRPVEDGGPLYNLLRDEMRELFLVEASSDIRILGSNNGEYLPEEIKAHGRQYKFLKREGIKSTAFVSLGFDEEVLGSLFLNYRTSQIFDSDYKERLRAMAAVLTSALTFRRDLDRQAGTLGGIESIAHSKSEFAFAAIRNELEALRDGGASTYDEALIRINKLAEIISRKWATLYIAGPENFTKIRLAEGMLRLKERIKELFPEIEFRAESDPTIERAAVSVKELMYKLIAEAVANAVLHAEPTQVNVSVTREKDHWHLKISNNGQAMDELDLQQLNSLQHLAIPLDHEPGIKGLLREALKWFAARWEYRISGSETILDLMIPFLY